MATLNEREPILARDCEPGDDIDPESSTFFFDFDGVLAEIAPRPDLVRPGPATVAALTRLSRLSSGRVVIVSGRPIREIDGFLAPLRLPAAGVHGLEIRDPDGSLVSAPFDEAVHRDVAAGLQRFAEANEGLLAEPKRGSVALHYRARPELEDACLALAGELLAAHPALAMVCGKMVVELRLGGRTKGHAVSHFMDKEGFAGTMPVFFGDDVTDEDGFRQAIALGGRGYKIGPGQSRAGHRFADIHAFQAWLARFGDGSEELTGADAKSGNRKTGRTVGTGGMVAGKTRHGASEGSTK